MERTPDVNLAYTVLKNPTLRDEYIWMSHHYELKQIYDFITEEEKYPDELNDARIQELIAEKMREFEKIFGRIR
jgi:curved DNA-binding protein CbpA